MIDLLIDVALMGLVLIALYGMGRTVRQIVPIRLWSRSADAAYSMGFGVGLIATLLFFLGLVGLLKPAAGWVVLIGGVVLAVVQHRLLRDDARAALDIAQGLLRASWFVKAIAAVGLAFMLMNFGADLAPPIEGDTVNQYLLAPREWVAAGRYTQPTNIWASTLPGNVMMLSAWALLLRHSYSLASLVTGFGMSLFLAAAIYALARLHFGREVAGLASLAIYTMPDAGYLAQSAKVDLGWALFETLALAAVMRWMAAKDARDSQHSETWLILAGVCLGLAAGSKTQTLISAALLGAWIALRTVLRRDWRGLVRGVVSFGLAILIAALPYILYNAIAHANPFYPVFADAFARFGGTPSPRSELGTEVFYPWTVGGYLSNLWNMSLGHDPAFYLGFIVGPIFMLAIPIGAALGAYHGRRIVWWMLGYAFAFSLIWFVVKQAARHFLPGLVLLAVIVGVALWWIDQNPTPLRRVVQAAAISVLIGNLVTWLGVLYWSGAYRVALGMEAREDYLSRWHNQVASDNVPDWDAITDANTRLDRSDRILTTHAGSQLYYVPQIVSGNWGDRLAYDAIRDPDELLAQLADHHIEFIQVFKADGPGGPLYAQPEFLAANAELHYDGPRTQLYRLAAPGGE